jgi:hypothetical protein
MKQRPTTEILAAIDDDSLNPKARKKALVKALLEFGPMLYLINLKRFPCLPSVLSAIFLRGQPRLYLFEKLAPMRRRVFR